MLKQWPGVSVLTCTPAGHLGSWGFEEVSTEIVSHQTEKGPSALAIAQVKVWIKTVEFQPVGWGQSRVTKGDIGDAKKGAQTDAIKKALSYFSIASFSFQYLLQVYGMV